MTSLSAAFLVFILFFFNIFKLHTNYCVDIFVLMMPVQMGSNGDDLELLMLVMEMLVMMMELVLLVMLMLVMLMLVMLVMMLELVMLF